MLLEEVPAHLVPKIPAIEMRHEIVEQSVGFFDQQRRLPP